MKIDVVYGAADEVHVAALELPSGSTVQSAIEASGFLEHFESLDLNKNKVGVFNKEVSLETLLTPNDRVEIYRPLLIDPKDRRRKRAQR